MRELFQRAYAVLMPQSFAPDHIKLLRGSIAAIVSDGVVSGEDIWIVEAMEAYTGDDAKELARNILEVAAEKHIVKIHDSSTIAVRTESDRTACQPWIL